MWISGYSILCRGIKRRKNPTEGEWGPSRQLRLLAMSKHGGMSERHPMHAESLMGHVTDFILLCEMRSHWTVGSKFDLRFKRCILAATLTIKCKMMWMEARGLIRKPLWFPEKVVTWTRMVEIAVNHGQTIYSPYNGLMVYILDVKDRESRMTPSFWPEETQGYSCHLPQQWGRLKEEQVEELSCETVLDLVSIACYTDQCLGDIQRRCWVEAGSMSLVFRRDSVRAGAIGATNTESSFFRQLFKALGQDDMT